MGVSPHADARHAPPLMLADGNVRFVVITPQQNGAVDFASFIDRVAHPDNRVVDLAAVDDAAVGDDGVIDLGPVDLGSRQKTRPCENGRAHVKKLKRGNSATKSRLASK